MSEKRRVFLHRLDKVTTTKHRSSDEREDNPSGNKCFVSAKYTSDDTKAVKLTSDDTKAMKPTSDDTGGGQLSHHEALCILWVVMQSFCGCIARHKKPILGVCAAALLLFGLYKVLSETLPNKVKTRGYPVMIYPATEYKSLQEYDVSLNFFETQRWKAMYIYAFTNGAMWGSDTPLEKLTPQWISQLESKALEGATNEVDVNKQLNAAVYQTLTKCVNEKQSKIVAWIDQQITYAEISEHFGATRVEEYMLEHAETVVSNFVKVNLHTQDMSNNALKYFFKTFAIAIIVIASGMSIVNLCNNCLPHFCILVVVVIVTVMTFCCHVYGEKLQFALPYDLLTDVDPFLLKNAACIANIDPLMANFAQAAKVIEEINYVGTPQDLHTAFLDLPKCTKGTKEWDSNLFAHSGYELDVGRAEDLINIGDHEPIYNDNNKKMACVVEKLNTFLKHTDLAISVCSAITSMLSYRELREHFYAVIRDTPYKSQKDIMWRIALNCTTIEVAVNLVKNSVFQNYLQNAVELWTNTVHGNTFLGEEKIDRDLQSLQVKIKTEKMRVVQQGELAVCQKGLESKIDDWFKARIGGLLKPPLRDLTNANVKLRVRKP